MHGSESHKPPKAYSFRSSRALGWERFLAAAVGHALHVKLRSPEDFLRHFSAQGVMASLANRPDERARILQVAVGTHPNIGVHKSCASAAADLQLALDHGIADPAAVISGINPDELLDVIERKKLWQFIIENKFWLIDEKTPDLFAVARAHVCELLERALAEDLIDIRQLIEAVTFEELIRKVPRPLLAKILELGWDAGRNGEPFGPAQVTSVLPMRAIVHVVPLSRLWNRVVVPFIASVHGFNSSGDHQTASVESRDSTITMEAPYDDDDAALPPAPSAPRRLEENVIHRPESEGIIKGSIGSKTREATSPGSSRSTQRATAVGSRPKRANVVQLARKPAGQG